MGKGQELLDAAREGDRRTVEKVIGHILTKRSGPFPSLRRIGVNVQDDSGYTSLHHACLNGHREIVQLLLSVSASPCIKNKSGGTPLHLAAFKGYADIVRMLLENTNPPVNIDEVTGNGETALLIAAQFGFKDVVALLESRGADVTIKNRKDESPLDLAAQYGRLEVVRHLIYVRPQLIDPYRLSRMRDSIHLGTNTSPLHLAARSAHNEVIEVLLNAGVDPNIRNDNGSALHEAFARDETIRLLLSRGADLRVRNKRGKTLADVLADFPAEATRKVRAVIREFSHDSEEDLPRFPIDIDQSPTGYVGSGRRRWDDLEGMSEGDALSLSSVTSSCAPLHLAHHHDYSKVSPTPPKKPPRRNLSVSPTHANSPSSGYSYELRVHARSQDDLDDIQGAKHYLKHGRSVDHYVDSKLSYSEYEENHNSPRVVPIPNPRSSLKHRSQPVAITAMYENVAIKEQNPKRKLRRNNFDDSYEPKMTGRKYSHQKSSLESLLDDQSMNSPSSCERYYDGPRVGIPLSPTHYEQPPTPEHPPPSARQAENSIHERIRPLSQLIMEVVEEIRIRKKSQGDSVKNS